MAKSKVPEIFSASPKSINFARGGPRHLSVEVGWSSIWTIFDVSSSPICRDLVTRMLSGLISKWTYPWAWMYSRALQICMTTSRSSCSSKVVEAPRRSSPRMNSLTMNQSWLSETLPKSCTRARFGWRNLVSASYSTLDHSSESSTRSDRSNLSATLRRTWRMSSHRNTVPIAPAPSCRSTRYLPLMHSPALKEPMMTPGTGLQGAADDTYRSWVRIRRNRRCRRCPATTDQRNRGLRRPMGEEEHLNGG